MKKHSWILLLNLLLIGIPSEGFAEEPEQRKELEARAQARNTEGMHLYRQGKTSEALKAIAEALAIRRQLHDKEDHPDLASSLINMGYLLNAMGRSKEALPFYEQALEMLKRIHKNQDHAALALGLNNMGSLLQAMGQIEKALPVYQQSLDMLKRLFKTQDHPYLAGSLNNMGLLLQELGRTEEAVSFTQQALDMYKRIHKGQDHPDLASSLNNLGLLLRTMGQPEKALPRFQQSLDMYKRIHKDRDHPDLASSLSNMGYLLNAVGQTEKASLFYTQALQMRQRIYKGQDHPDLASSLNNVGLVLQVMDQREKALPFTQQALDMRQRIYKDQDHPDLARSLNNMGYLLQEMGQWEKALSFTRQALDMHQRMNMSKGHPDLALTLNNMGMLLQAMGQVEKALPFFEQALTMQRRLGDRFAYSTSLADALDRIVGFPDSRSAYLATSRRLPTLSSEAHAVVWSTKATLAQLYRARREIVHSHEFEQLDELRGQLRNVQRRLSGLISTPNSPQRDRELTDLTDRQQQLEQGIAKLLPDWRPLTGLGLAQLHAALGPSDAFIDFYRYFGNYVAFVATPEGSRRIELGTTEPIDAAIAGWLRAIEHHESEDRFGIRLRSLLWKPIEAHLPSGTQRVFVSVDGDLGRVPFGAMPGSKPDSVLLERFAFATVESGPFLLDALTNVRPVGEDTGTLLIAGGIQYDSPGVSKSDPWDFLPGTEREHREVGTLWGERATPISASGHDATTDWLLENLPKARYAHLATHGQFNATEYAREQIRLSKARESLFANPLGQEGLSGLGIRNPLGYVGIVMAGANAPTKDSPDRGIVAGTSIWPMDLSELDLVVLSACETGLGKDTGSAGVANLTLAFHVAGCKNVVASLWKVNDAVTEALMAKFYHALWKQNKPPLEALREAQLHVYHHPEVAINWDAVVKRGQVEEALRAPKKVAAELPDGGKRRLDDPSSKAPLPERTPTKYWAAFTLSGVGK